jgi:hypothetical protein
MDSVRCVLPNRLSAWMLFEKKLFIFKILNIIHNYRMKLLTLSKLSIKGCFIPFCVDGKL